MNNIKSYSGTLTQKSVKQKRAKPFSISRRFAIVLTTAVIMVSTITIIAFYTDAIRVQEKELKRKAVEYRDYLIGALEVPLWSYDDKSVNAICKTFTQNELVVKLVVTNSSGAVIYNYVKANDSDAIEGTGKISHDGEILGKIKLALTKQYIKESVHELVSTYATIMLFVVIALVFLTLILMRIFLKKPISTLDKIVGPYAKGIYDLPMPDLPYIEFLEVGKTLSKMGETIRFQMNEIRDAEKKYHSIFENAMEGIFQCTSARRYLSVNPAFANILGYDSPDEVVTSVSDIAHQHYVNPEDWINVQKIIEEKDFMESFETEAYCKDRSRIWVSINVRAIRDQNRKLLYYEGSLENITERKRAEIVLKNNRDHLEALVKERTTQLEIAKDAAESANKAKSTFLANMSHELRTPLNAVLGFARLMKEGADVTTEQRKNLDIITLSGGHLLNLINNVLDISKIESGRMTLVVAPIDLYQLIQEMKSLLYVNAEERGLSFIVEQSPELPRRIDVDGGKLRQILINLTGNAIKFTKQGGVVLRAMVTKREYAEKVWLRFEVEDTGPGISEEDRKKIFQPFVQLRKEGAIQTGTGLGLALCKQYVDIMGGRIDCISENGKGTVFFFEIPAKELPYKEISIATDKGHVIGLEEGQQRFRLLIVEDQPENRLLLRKILEPLYLDIREAANGKEALVIFAQWNPDLIFMDIRMPDMDGFEATHRIKSTENGSHTKIVAITAHALEEEKMRTMQAGCDDFIRKPYRSAEIFDALSRHLGVRFIYEKKLPKPPAELELELRSEQLAALPSELLNKLHQAAIELDIDRTQELIDQVIKHNESIGKAFKKLTDKLDYDYLQKLLDAYVKYQEKPMNNHDASH
jgi:PAS domain S-box-containing protein